MLLRVLLVSTSRGLRDRVESCLPESVLLLEGALEKLDAQLAGSPTDVVLLHADAHPPLDELRTVLASPDHPAAIVLAEREDPVQRAAMLTAGCLAVVYARLPDPLFGETLSAVLGRHRPASRVDPRDAPTFRLRDYVSASPAMRGFLRLAHRAAGSESTLLLLGETGVRKEWLARAIHAEGPRRREPFVALSCAALPETLLESELFGHEKGSFTGASRSRRGLFELAHRGVLFLDEVGELPLHLQAKLLRVLDEPGIRPIGSERTVPVDVRIMAATNRDLAAEVRAGRFRQDLFYRLDVLSLALPPLRDRREDIPALVDGYREHFGQRLRRDVGSVAPDALHALVAHPWPGNVRELINVMERAVLLAENPAIGLADLPPAIALDAPAGLDDAALPPGGAPPTDWLCRPWREVRAELLDRAERSYLTALLRECEGQLREVAERAGIEPRSLFEKMRRHGLRKEDFRVAVVPGAAPRRRRSPRPGAGGTTSAA